MPFNFESLTDYVLVITAFFGAFLSALWLSLVIWTFRDMRARSRDIFAQILAALVVGVLDLDSPDLARFDEEDRAGCERLVAILLRHHPDWP